MYQSGTARDGIKAKARRKPVQEFKRRILKTSCVRVESCELLRKRKKLITNTEQGLERSERVWFQPLCKGYPSIKVDNEADRGDRERG